MRNFGGIILFVALLFGCSSSRKVSRTESRAAVEVVENQTAASSEQAQTVATLETVTVSEAVSLDSGRINIERDSAGLPVAINWRRAVSGSAAKEQNEQRHEERAAESQTAAETQSSTRAQNSEEVQETKQQREPFWNSFNIAMSVVALISLCFYIWVSRK